MQDCEINLGNLKILAILKSYKSWLKQAWQDALFIVVTRQEPRYCGKIHILLDKKISGNILSSTLFLPQFPQRNI